MSESTALPRFHLSTDGMEREEALAIYREAARDLFRTSPIPGAPYRVEMEAWHLGTIMLGRFASSGIRFERDWKLVASSGIDHILVQLYVGGELTLDIGGERISVRKGEIAIFDLASVVTAHPAEVESVNLLVPRSFIGEAVDDPASLHGRVLGTSDALGAMLGSYLLALENRIGGLDPRQAATAARATASLVATLLGAVRGPEGGSGQSAISPFRLIAGRIEASLRDPSLSIPAIASELGVSRTSLYRIFAPVGGVADYVRRRRLAGAAVALSAPQNSRRKIAEIAREWGFASDVTFSRAFKNAFGISPAAARASGAVRVAHVADESISSPRGFAHSLRLLQA